MRDIEKQMFEFERRIATIPDTTARDDLSRMLGGCRRLVTELSRESVVCRQRGRHTEKYRQLVLQYQETTDTMEGYLIQAVLTYL